MANADILKGEDENFHSSILRVSGKLRGQLIEKKIDVLESLAEKVSNRRSRRWLNDRLLIELVPRLNVEEIRGLFAPPPWGDDAPLSAFCMTNVVEWDLFRSIDMDTEARIIKSLEKSSVKRKDHADKEKAAALNAWHRVDCRTRVALRRDSLFNLVERYEVHVRAFIKDGADEEVLVLHVQDPFRRFLLHGVCEFYNLNSVTVCTLKGAKLWKTTSIKKKPGSGETSSNISLTGFLKMAKNGVL